MTPAESALQHLPDQLRTILGSITSHHAQGRVIRDLSASHSSRLAYDAFHVAIGTEQATELEFFVTREHSGCVAALVIEYVDGNRIRHPIMNCAALCRRWMQPRRSKRRNRIQPPASSPRDSGDREGAAHWRNHSNGEEASR
jgi:hypothetical protein